MYLIFDLDDTLLTDDKQISKYTKNILKKCQSLGHLIVINSARPYARIKEYADMIDADYVIPNGGAEIYNRNELIFKDYINKDMVNKLLDIFKDNKKVNDISIQSDYLYTKNLDFISKNDHARFNDFSAYFDEDASKFLITTNDEKLPYKVAKKFELEITRYLGGNWYRFSTTNKEKGNKNLYKLLNDTNPKSVAFGDDIGDYEMLRDATIGVAMKNSVSELLEKISVVTEYSNNEDGCARYIEELLDNGIL